MFTISLKALATNIAYVKRAAGYRASRAGMEALKVFRVSVSDGVAELSFYNFDTAVSVRMPVVGADLPETVVNVDELANAVRSAGGKSDASVSVEGDVLVIAADGVSVSVPVLFRDDDSLPALPVVEGGDAIVIEGSEFANATAAVGSAIGKDATLPMLTGVRVEVEDGTAHFATTDRFRLVTARVKPANLTGDVAELVAGTPFLAAGKRACKDPAVSIRFGTVSNIGHVEVVTEDSTVISRLPDYDFPKWRQLLPGDDEQFLASFTVDAKTLAARFKSLASAARHARIQVDEDGTVTVDGIDELTHSATPKTTFTVPVGEFETADGLGLTSAFDPKYLAEILATVPKGEKVHVGFRSNRMMTLRWSDVDALVMPVRLAGDA